MKKAGIVMLMASVVVHCEGAYSMQGAVHKKIVAEKNNNQKHYPPIKTVPEARRRIQQHSTILKNLKHLPPKEFRQKKHYAVLLDRMSQMFDVAEASLACASARLPEAQFANARAVEQQCLAVFNKSSPALFNSICALGLPKKH